MSDGAHGTRGAIAADHIPPCGEPFQREEHLMLLESLLWQNNTDFSHGEHTKAVWMLRWKDWRWSSRFLTSCLLSRTLLRTLQFIHTSSVGFRSVWTLKYTQPAGWCEATSFIFGVKIRTCLSFKAKWQVRTFCLPSLAGFWGFTLLLLTTQGILIYFNPQSKCSSC